MKSYQLQVRKSKELLCLILDKIPLQSKISFEGNLQVSILNKKYLLANEALGLLLRRTRTPKSDILIFNIDNDSKNYLKNDFIQRIGLKKNVNHIQIQNEDKLIFSAYDNFDEESTTLKESYNFTIDFINELVNNKIIGKFKEIKNEDK